MTRVLIVDDHAIVRIGLERLLANDDEFEVVGVAHDGRAAISSAAALVPDVVLMDYSLPDMSGADATRQISAAHPQVKVIMLSAFGTSNHVSEAFEAGASGFFVKDVDPVVLIDGIKSVRSGGVPVSPSVGALLLHRGRQQPEAAQPTNREREVLRLIVDGNTNKQIARRLGISEKTVKAHCSRMFERLGVHDRTQAALWAERHPGVL